MLFKLTFFVLINCLFFILAAGIPDILDVHSSYPENKCGPAQVWNIFEQKCTQRFIFSKPYHDMDEKEIQIAMHRLRTIEAEAKRRLIEEKVKKVIKWGSYLTPN